ncbi:MAG: hypothetical protein QNK37_37560 [Acidobacteriota bacterium]|nr:hypothetical protein [Acidobacteriota bacterium]
MLFFFDGQCPACAQGVQFFKRLGLMRRVTPQPLAEAVVPQHVSKHFYRQSVLYDPETDTAYGGWDGFARLLQLRHPRLDFTQWVQRPLVRRLLDIPLYLFSQNRRVLFPVRCDTACAVPRPSRLNRAVFSILMILGALLGSLIFGAAIGSHRELSSGLIAAMPEDVFYPLHITVKSFAAVPGFDLLKGGLFMIGAAGAGWIVCLAGFALLLRTRIREIFEQFLVVMNIGVAFLLFPSAILFGMHFFAPSNAAVTAVILGGVILDGILMTRSIIKRSHILNLPNWTPWLWLLLLQAGGLPLLIYLGLLW